MGHFADHFNQPVKSRLSNILSMLGIASRTETVTLALRNRILP